MLMCAKCNKRVAVVFVTKMENGKKTSEGYCSKCAREMGVPIEGMLGDSVKKMGLTPEQFAQMEEGAAGVLNGMDLGAFNPGAAQKPEDPESEEDRNALHVALADQSYCIGGAEASGSYLNENQIISTAILAGAQAIHPGYGFLSENPHFAQICK